MKNLLLVTFAVFSISTQAQDLLSLQQKYPGEDLVMLSNKSAYRITMQGDSITATCSDEEDWIYLTDKSALLKKEGWFNHSGFRELGAYKAYTTIPSGRKMEATDYKTTANTADGIFYDDSKLTSFKFPGLTKGATTHQEYEVRFRNPLLLSPHYFTRGLPTAFNELKISFPKNIRMRYVLFGLEKSRVNFKEETGRQGTTWTFTAKDMPRENAYGDAPEHPHWATHVVFYIEAYQSKDGKWKNLLSSPADLYSVYRNYVRSINQEIGPELKHITDSLVLHKTSAKDKAAAIYAWAQQHVKYIAFEQGMEGFIPRDANLVCTRRYGDCKDFSSLITTMLRYAGLKAYYTWIGTRSLPYTYAETPTPVVDNHMISTLDLDGKLIYLDGTDPTCVFGWPSSHIQGKEALIGIDSANFRIETVPVPPASANQIHDTSFVRFSDKGIEGTIHQVLEGYYAMDFHARYAAVAGKERDDFIKGWISRGSNKFQCTGYRITDSATDGSMIGITASFNLPDYGKTIGNDRFINLHLEHHYEHEEIDYPKRKMPVSFRFRFAKAFVTVLEKPKGWKLDYLPEAQSFSNETWGYTMQYRDEPGQVILTKQFTNANLYIQPSQFASWNKVLETLYPQYKASVSLTYHP